MLNRISQSVAGNMTASTDYPPRFASERAHLAGAPHQIEREVQRELLAQPHLKFASLVVRRLENGVCLQGVLEADEDAPDVVSIAQRVAGVDQVLNHLLVAPNPSRPPKG